MEALPYDDDRFDAVTGFNAYELAADPVNALREARRVARPGAPVLVATWGRRDRCEAAACLEALARLCSRGSPEELVWSADGALEAAAERAGLHPAGREEVLCAWTFRDEDHAVRALSSTGPAADAAEAVGSDLVREVIVAAIEPYAMSGGGFRLENTFTHLVTQV
jgi:SAM-dependent methyltransferase